MIYMILIRHRHMADDSIDLFVRGSIFIYCELILSIECKVFIFTFILPGPRTIGKHMCGKNFIETDLNLVRVRIFGKKKTTI